MNIKKVDDKPMVIHAKEKTKIHVKGTPETKLKGRNILTVERGPKVSGSDSGAGHISDAQKRSRTAAPKLKDSRITVKQAVKKGAGATGRKTIIKEAEAVNQNRTQSIASQYKKTKQDNENAIKKKSSTVKMAGTVGTKAVINQMEGGSEVYDSWMVMRTMSAPVGNATDAGRRLYRSQAARAKAQKIKKAEQAKRIGKKAVKDSAVKAAKKAAKETAKTTVKETAKLSAKAAATTAATAAGTATTGPGGILIGAAAGEAAGIAMDRRDLKHSSRNRMLQFFLAKMRQEDQQDSIAKTLKDLVMMRFSMMAKYLIRYVGLFLLALFALVALLALPIIAVLAVIYSSPFAIFFPSISSGDTTQTVLSGYVAEFNREVNDELTNYAGYDESEKIYVDFEGAGTPDNYYDILAVYMVKYGNGDTATDMTDKAKENLKKVFDDMCSYSISSRTDTETDDEGNTTTTTVKEVRIVLKTYRDMISEYSFDSEQQEMLAELMKPEYLAMIGYTGGGGDPGEAITPEQYRAIVDAISDANGKKVLEYALSKVGYPYSQDYRDTGDYYDCSSLAYYSWQNAGVNIMYEGANTAAAEGKYCYDNSLLVNFEEMQPGDLIFFSYSKNGRFMDITHVAIYAGNGKLVEAANESIGVVYRDVHSQSSIVLIGRPR